MFPDQPFSPLGVDILTNAVCAWPILVTALLSEATDFTRLQCSRSFTPPRSLHRRVLMYNTKDSLRPTFFLRCGRYRGAD